jgi:hypothetical protein
MAFWLGLKILVSVVRFRPEPPTKSRLAAMQAFFTSSGFMGLKLADTHTLHSSQNATRFSCTILSYWVGFAHGKT